MKDRNQLSDKIIIGLFAFSLLVSSITFFLHYYSDKSAFLNSSAESFEQFKSIQDFLKKSNNSKAFILLEDESLIIEHSNSIASINNYLGRDNSFSLEESTKKLLSQSVSVDRQNLQLQWNKERSGALNLFQFVSQNRWRTLTRIGLRVKSRFRSKINGSANDSIILKNNISDFRSMIKVTNSSSLLEANKQRIRERVKILIKSHQDMIKKMEAQLLFKKDHQKILDQVKVWAMQVEPQLVTGLKYNNKIKKFISLFLMTIIGLLLISFTVYFYFRKRIMESNHESVENTVINAIDQLIIKNDLGFIDDYSANFQSSMLAFSEYIKKRVSFGLMFQEALPLPALLLDRHLKLKWFNKHFLEQWGIEAEQLLANGKTWDFLKEKTNIGANDPIFESLESNISGIYQIQIKPIPDEEPRPYQMYVSPVNVYGEQSLMLFFYPLITLEETVSIQTKSIVDPVSQTLERIVMGEYDDKFEAESLRNYNMASIDHLHTMFSKLMQQHKNEVDVLLKEISDLENTIKDDHQKISEYRKINEGAVLNIGEQIKRFQQLKNDIIQISDLANSGIGGFFEQKRKIQVFHEEFNTYSGKYLVFYKELSTFIKSLPLIMQMKENIKTSKNDFKTLGPALAGLGRSLEKVLGKEEQVGIKKAALVQNIEEVKRSLKMLLNYEKNLMSLDIFFSKFALIVEELLKRSDSEVLMNDFKELKSDLNTMVRSMEDLQLTQEKVEKAEEQVVGSIKDFYMQMKTNRQLYSEKNGEIQ
jgi:hypothetical protein